MTVPVMPRQYIPSLACHPNDERPAGMPAKHRLKRRRTEDPAPRQRAIELVDACTLTAHFLTMDALAAGRLPEGRYIALCGQDLVPACLVEPGRDRCASCVSIPTQKSRP